MGTLGVTIVLTLLTRLLLRPTPTQIRFSPRTKVKSMIRRTLNGQ
jgi:hypothetical protein